MKKLSLSLVLLCSLFIAFADDNSKNIESKIEKVTVYLDGAQITRTAKTAVGTGKTELVFGGLSPYLDKSSVSIEAKGNVNVLSVVQQMNKLNEQKKKAEVEIIEKRKELFAEKLQDEQTQKLIDDQLLIMLSKNQQVNSQHTDLKVVDLKAALDYHEQRMREVRASQLAHDRAIDKLSDTIIKLEAQLKAMNAKNDPSTSDLVVTVESKAGGSISFEISYFVNYAGWFPTYDLRVDDITKPLNIAYRAHVHQNTGEDWKDVKLTLSNAEPKITGVIPKLNTWYVANGTGYKAPSVYNNTQYPGRYPVAGIAEVKGKVYDDTGEPLIGATIVVKGTTIGTSTDYDGNYSLKLPYGQNYLTVTYIGYNTQDIPVFASEINIRMTQTKVALNEVTVASSKYESKMSSQQIVSMDVLKARAADREFEQYGYLNTTPGVTTIGRLAKTEELGGSVQQNINTSETFSPTTYSFEIETPYTILNNGKTYTVDIKSQDIPVDYIYVTIPKLDLDAFLTARIIGWEEYNLLDGEANLYFEGTYLGKTLLNTSAEDDTIELSLGRDKNVSVTRAKLKDFSKKTFFGDKKIASRAFDITVRNNKKQPINIVVLDQFPVSTQKEIEVDKQEYKDATLDEATGQLKWVLQIPAASEKKVGLKYAIKYPKYYSVQVE